MPTVIIQISNIQVSFKDRNTSYIKGEDVLSFLIGRIKKETNYNVVIATSNQAEDNIFENIALKNNIDIYRGSFINVLDRICNAANMTGEDDFVRVFANYPLVDLKEMVGLYQDHVNGGYDYSYNEHSQGVLWGTGCEIFNTKFINGLNKDNLSVSQCETISYYIRQNESRFKVLKRSITYKRPWYKLILENPKDLEVIRELVDKLDVIDNASIIEYLKNHTVLGKYNLDAPSKEVGIDKLYLHPSKIANLINANGYDMSYPISVEMTLTNTCNLRCVYCSDNELRLRQGLNQDIDLEVIKNLFDDLAGGGTTGITLEGGGEPSLYSKFSEVVFYAKSKGLALGLITNGTVRISEDLLKEFEWIRVSLDASTAEEYVDLKGVDCFEKVLSNIAHYSKYCNTVGIGYVVTNKNISQIEALVMRLRELGVSYIQLRPVVDCPELYPEGVDLSYLMVYQNSTFGVIIDGMKENAESGNFNLPCVANGITSVISGNGNVYICGRLNIYDWLKPIGNINEQSFHDIWNGMERKKQLEMVNDKIFCTANCPQCRVSKFNRLVDRLNNIKSKDFI